MQRLPRRLLSTYCRLRTGSATFIPRHRYGRKALAASRNLRNTEALTAVHDTHKAVDAVHDSVRHTRWTVDSVGWCIVAVGFLQFLVLLETGHDARDSSRERLHKMKLELIDIRKNQEWMRRAAAGAYR